MGRVRCPDNSESSISDLRLGEDVDVDVDSTFTDLVAIGGGRPVRRCRRYDRGQRMAAGAITALAHGMTVATKALLERDGARVAPITTEGFRDILEGDRAPEPAGAVRPDRAPA